MRLPLLAALAATVTVAVGCGVPTDDEARRIPAEELPSGLASTVTPAGTTPTTTGPSSTDPTAVAPGELPIDGEVVLYTVLEGELVATAVGLVAPATIDDVVALVESPPTEAPGRTVLRPEDVVSVTRTGTVVTVELLDTVLELPTAEQVLAVGQLVLTLTSAEGIDRVGFTVDGAPAVVPLPEGTAGEGPIGPDDVRALVAAREAPTTTA